MTDLHIINIILFLFIQGNIGQPGDKVQLITPIPEECGLSGDALFKEFREYIFTGKLDEGMQIILTSKRGE